MSKQKPKRPEPKIEPLQLQGESTALPVADVEEAPSQGPSAEDVAAITLNTSRALKLQEMLIPEAEAELKKLQEELKGLKEVVIPNLLTHAQVSGWEYKDRNDGQWKVGLVEEVKASVTKANKPSFIDWLIQQKLDDIVKRKITIKFGRDQVKLAKKFLNDLAKRKIDLHPEVDEDIHAGTLNAWVKERRQQAIDRGRDPDTVVPESVSIFKLRYVELEKVENKKGVVPLD